MVKKKLRVRLQRTKRCLNKRVFVSAEHAREAAEKLEHDVMFSSKVAPYHCGIHHAYHIGHDRSGKNASSWHLGSASAKGYGNKNAT